MAVSSNEDSAPTDGKRCSDRLTHGVLAQYLKLWSSGYNRCLTFHIAEKQFPITCNQRRLVVPIKPFGPTHLACIGFETGGDPFVGDRVNVLAVNNRSRHIRKAAPNAPQRGRAQAVALLRQLYGLEAPRAGRSGSCGHDNAVFPNSLPDRRAI